MSVLEHDHASNGRARQRTAARAIMERRTEHATMGHLSTHVLDTMNGCPAAGMAVELHRSTGGGSTLVKSLVLNADGRAAEGPLLDAAAMAPGRYRLVFAVAAYFRARGVALPDPPFIDMVQLDFGIADAAGHYHVPLLVSPWSYTTYRGS
jgi:5-hydroxyisourate hydrolase